jgi:hypothetical protein
MKIELWRRLAGAACLIALAVADLQNSAGKATQRNEERREDAFLKRLRSEFATPARLFKVQPKAPAQFRRHSSRRLRLGVKRFREATE